jgi:regulator of protease activity HflC (stomatin/prohibitin superfamily)
LSSSDTDWQRKIGGLVARLDPTDRRHYETLLGRCRAILDQQLHGGEIPHGLDSQSEGLGRLLWMYLRLLVARQAIRHVLADAERGESLSARLKGLDAQIEKSDLSDDLRRSLNSQAEILRQRLAQQTEARQKLAFLDAELTRIQEQAELIREQAALSTDPEILSQRIDEIAATLGGTSQWIRDQQKVYGAMEDLLSEPPPLATSIRVRESQ